jgi:hypothetical protein
MNFKNVTKSAFAILVFGALSACGGGSGGSGDGGAVIGGSGDQWLTLANISKNGCGDRITDVRQTFIVGNGVVNTSLVTIPAVETDSGFDFAFTESNGDCTRTYTAHFTNVSGSTANVELISDSACLTQTCQNTWTGTATKQ